MRLALSVALAVATAAALFAPAASAQSQAAISINFRGNGGNLVTGPAGAVGTTPFGGWNNVNGGSGSGVVVLDHAGVDRGVRLAFASASAGYQLNPAATSQDGNLYDGQIIATVAAGPATVTVSNVPYAQYDVVVYFGHGPSHVGRDESLTIGSRVVCYQNENLQTYVNPVTFRQVTTTSVPGQAGNYAVFAGETGSSFTLVMAPAAGGTPGSTGMAGLQIVDRGADTDNDGLNDAWELQWFGNLSQTAAGDPDADQLHNLGEQQRGTSPVDADSDDDGLTDGAEVARGTDPLDGDSDDDELSDGVETDTGIFVNLNNTGTDPLLVDTDGDGSRDGAEVRRRSNPCDPNSRPQLPNVVLILADDLGWGEVGAFGQQLIRTPNLDQMAADGMRFTQFYCGSPVCAPTRSTIQTGLHTGHTEIRNNLASAALDPGTFTLGNMLQREGYTTAFIGKWGIGDTGTTGHPNLQGYDHFFGFLDQTHAHWYYPSYLWRNGQQVLYPTNNGVAGPTNNGTLHAQDEMTAEALTWLDNHHDRPFFLQLAYCIPHVSLQEPPHSDPARRALGETAVEEFYPNIGWAEPNANFASSHYTSNARPRQAYAAMISALDR
ncbi:MAG: Arylsulfatase, partial [Planctomycetota bacterium]